MASGEKIRRFLDLAGTVCGGNGRLRWLSPVHGALESFFFTPAEVTRRGAHIRDSMTLKRAILAVTAAQLPCLAVGFVRYGWRFLAMLFVSFLAGTLTEVAAARLRGKPLDGTTLPILCMVPLLVPASVPLWMMMLSLVPALVFGKVAFGGAGMNIWNPAALACVLLTFGYPLQMAGGVPAAALPGWWPLLAVCAGALLLLYAGLISWRIVAASLAGLLFAAFLHRMAAPSEALPPGYDLSHGTFLFCTVFLATDPVTSAQTTAGKWICGFLAGACTVLLRIFSPVFRDGAPAAVLLMNTLAPWIDRCVVSVAIRYRNTQKHS